MKAHPDITEGPEAFDRFRKAVKSIISVPKMALPPKPHRQKAKSIKRKV